jgi:hypothetical protein
LSYGAPAVVFVWWSGTGLTGLGLYRLGLYRLGLYRLGLYRLGLYRLVRHGPATSETTAVRFAALRPL